MYRRRFGKKRRWGGSLAKQRQEYFVLYSGIVVLVFLLIIIGLSFASKIPRFLITNVEIEGNSITSNQKLNEVVEKELSGAYLRLFSRRNSFIYPKNKIRKRFLEEFKRLEEVSLATSDFKKLNIKVKERSPDAMWCGESFNLSSKTCYFLDGQGFIYSLAPEFSGNVFFKNFGSVFDTNNPIGQNFLSIAKYQNLKLFRNVLLKNDIEPIALNKLSDEDVEIYLNNQGKVIYNLNQDVVKISSDLSSILRDESFKDSFFGDQKRLDYIDLRFDNKAYYKFK